jgi:hypothetical protein
MEPDFWEGQFNTDRPLVPRLEQIKSSGFSADKKHWNGH